MECEFCGRPLPDGARFCPHCGTPVSSGLGTEERKMVTVLFADLVDSTGLAQRLDAERAREVLGGFFDAASEELQALRGRPEKFIGDAVMAVFGLPQVQEDDAVRAVRAGLAIRDRMQRLQHSLGLDEPLAIRVGVETGEAATGVGPTGQLLVTGSVVNAAARLQAAAEPGEVLVGATTKALTKDAMSFGRAREVEAKGFDEVLAAHPVHELTTRSARRTIPFVGRSNELDILRGSVARVRATGRPLLVSILGEPGVGKTRLADELLAGLDPTISVLRGRAEAFGNTATFAPVTSIVRELAGIEDEMAPEDAMQCLQSMVEGCCDLTKAEEVASRLALTLGVGVPKRDESVFVQDVQSGFLTLLEGLSEQGPVVAVFEDVHTLRAPMLDLIERVGSTTEHAPRRTLTIALGRPDLLEQRPAWGSGAENAITLRLDPLPLPEAVELVREAAAGRIGDPEAEEIAARTGGNPFFIVETTGMVLRASRDGAAGSARSLPPTVQAVVAARLDSLRHRLRDVARRASVFLYSFDLAEIDTIADLDEDDLRGLEEAEILVREDGAGAATRWRFRHQTVREVAYASLPKRERRALHERVADVLTASGHRSYAADHLELAAKASLDLDPADRRLPERAADALVAAGDRARRRMESRTAIDFYRRALLMGGPEEGWGVREARALAGTGEAHYWLSEYPAASQALERAVELGEKHGDAWTLALALRYQGDIAINVDRDIDRAEELLADSLAAAGELEDEPWALTRSLLFAGWVPWTREDYDEADQIWHRALALAEEHGDNWARVRALTALSITKSQQREDEPAAQLIEQASEIAAEMGDRFSVAVTLVQRGRIDEDRGRYEDAIPRLERAIEIFKDLGARWEMADALAERGISFRDMGRLDEGEEDLRAAMRISQELGEQQIAGWTGRALDRLAQLRAEGSGQPVPRG